MSEHASAWFMIGLNTVMITYTLWVFSLSKTTTSRLRVGLGAGLAVWLALLHWVISNKAIFSPDISGIAFLASIFLFVGIVGALLFLPPVIRQAIVNLNQEQLLLFQGIRVFFGAGFLMQASLGNLPTLFGILDGWTHIAAGFLGLVASFCVASGNHGARRAWFANIFGLADILVVASTLALILLHDITPHHSMMYAVFLPAPLWLWFHLVSIWKLLSEDKRALNRLSVA